MCKFSGKGLVPDVLTAYPPFLPAVALGAGFTVIPTTGRGLPMSTTRGLTGGWVGAGTAAGGREVDLAEPGQAVALPCAAAAADAASRPVA